ncbi:MAG: alpha-amylase family glycosyl hydrolase, partial [Pseudomonadota bacterium]
YVWADPNPDGTPPNNWLSIFGGSGWQWDGRRLQYYLHNFLSSQPDLNFYSTEVQDALLDVARFWLDRGVDGVRLDTINFYFHDRQLRSNPPLPLADRNASIAPMVNPYNHQDHLYSKSQPENLAFLERLRRLTDSYDARACLGEVGDAQRGLEIMAQYTTGDNRMHMCYAFDFLESRRATADVVAQVFRDLEDAAPDGWACWAFSNHDVQRHASRWGLSDAATRTYATLIMCLRGSVCLYQGEELGLSEANVAYDDLKDPYGIEFWPEFKGRDGCRTPMVWEVQSENAGFGSGRPWLPVSEPQADRAVDRQEADPSAPLHHYRQAIALRRSHPALMVGEQTNMQVNETVLSFGRNADGQEIFCAFNLDETPSEVTLPAGRWQSLTGEMDGAVDCREGQADLPGWGYLVVQKVRE